MNGFSVFLFFSLFLATVTSCSFKGSKKFVSAQKVECQVPFRSMDGEKESVQDRPLVIQLGFEDQKQKTTWGETSGYPAAQIVFDKTVTEIPVKGLVGNKVGALKTQIAGSVCQGSVAVMDSLQRLWLVFEQGEANSLVFMAFDPKTHKIVDGHAPQQKIFGLNYSQGKLFYMTAVAPKTPTRVFVKREGKDVPLKEFSLPFWVRLDLAGKQRAAIDNLKTYSSSAFRSFFSSAGEFDQFFGLSQKGSYQKPWAYLANIGLETCLVATSKRVSGELKGSPLFCKESKKAPASVGN